MTQRKMLKGKNKNIRISTQTTKTWATRMPLKHRGELRCSGRVSSSYSTNDTCRVTVNSSTQTTKDWTTRTPLKQRGELSSYSTNDTRRVTVNSSTQTTKDWATQTPPKKEGNSGAVEVVAVPTPLMTPVVLLLTVLHLKKCEETVNQEDNHCRLHWSLSTESCRRDVRWCQFFSPSSHATKCMHYFSHKYSFHCWECVSQHDMEPVQLKFSARIVFKNPEILGRVSTHVYILIYYNWCTTTFSVKCFVFH